MRTVLVLDGPRAGENMQLADSHRVVKMPVIESSPASFVTKIPALTSPAFEVETYVVRKFVVYEPIVLDLEDILRVDAVVPDGVYRLLMKEGEEWESGRVITFLSMYPHAAANAREPLPYEYEFQKLVQARRTGK